MKRLDRASTVLSVALLGAAVGMAMLMTPPRVDAVLRLDITHNAEPIQHLDQARAVRDQRTVWIDRLDLAEGGQFRHRQLGQLGPGEQFFVDLELRLRNPESRLIHFEVESDDGFALEIDGERLCAFTAQRGLSAQRCPVLLSEGEHSLRLSYFQAGGPAGLRVRHGPSEEGPWVFLGEPAIWLEVIPAQR